MKKFFVLSMILFIGLISCTENKQNSQSSGSSSEVYEIKGNRVIIKDRLGMNGAKLSNHIYDDLKGKSGTYTVVIYENEYDSYGKKTIVERTAGSIDVNELNKYENFRVWNGKVGVPGIKKW